MSSRGNLITEAYTEACLAMAERHSDFVLGFICQQQVSPKFLSITPGVHLDVSGGKLGQQYRTPEEALVRDRCDIIIVGSGIYEAKDPAEAAKKYHEKSWLLA